MSFAELVDSSKSMREAVQQTPVPFIPPGLMCLRAGEDRAAVLAPRSDEASLAGMLAMIPASCADEVYLTLEGYVRPEDVQVIGPIAEDPWAQPALLILHVTSSGDVETSINPYTISDGGALMWAAPGAVTSPAIPKLIAAIQSLLQNEAQDHTVSRELCQWLAVNGYSLRVAKGVVEGQE